MQRHVRNSHTVTQTIFMNKQVFSLSLFKLIYKVTKISSLPGGTQTQGNVLRVFARLVSRTLPSVDSSMSATPVSIPRPLVSSGRLSLIGDVRLVIGQKEGR